MIVKELDPFPGGDRFEVAGRQAEEKMSHYLRRAFAADPDILVFNGVRLVTVDDAAQIDHLIVHPYGLIIIESTSVTAQVRVNALGEWTRSDNGHVRGMASPVLQAERQRVFLRSYLQREPGVLGGKQLAINVRVAIADDGVIDRRGSEDEAELESVFKADQIPEEIRVTIGDRRADHQLPTALVRLAGGAPDIHMGDTLTASDRERLRAFLLAHHARHEGPTAAAPVGPAPASSGAPGGVVKIAAEVRPTFCPRCRSTNLRVDYYYNFFLRCRTCNRAVPLVLRCSQCGTKHKKILKSQVVSEHGALSTSCSQCGASISLETR